MMIKNTIKTILLATVLVIANDANAQIKNKIILPKVLPNKGNALLETETKRIETSIRKNLGQQYLRDPIATRLTNLTNINKSIEGLSTKFANAANVKPNDIIVIQNRLEALVQTTLKQTTGKDEYTYSTAVFDLIEAYNNAFKNAKLNSQPTDQDNSNLKAIEDRINSYFARDTSMRAFFNNQKPLYNLLAEHYRYPNISNSSTIVPPITPGVQTAPATPEKTVAFKEYISTTFSEENYTSLPIEQQKQLNSDIDAQIKAYCAGNVECVNDLQNHLYNTVIWKYQD